MVEKGRKEREQGRRIKQMGEQARRHATWKRHASRRKRDEEEEEERKKPFFLLRAVGAKRKKRGAA